MEKGIDATPEDWQRILAVNVIGPALMAKHAVPHIKRAGGGAIVNLGSVSSFIAQKGHLTYNTTKGAVAEMTRCMALDLVDDGIRVNGVCPGSVWTAETQRMADEMGGLTREEAATQPNLGVEQMMRRQADPHEIGYAVLYLASEEASFVTGANLMVDGGWTAVGFANSSAALRGVELGRFGALVLAEGGLIALVIRVSRRAEPVRAGVAVGTVASVEGVGDSCASPRAGCSAASVGSAEADTG